MSWSPRKRWTRLRVSAAVCVSCAVVYDVEVVLCQRLSQLLCVRPDGVTLLHLTAAVHGHGEAVSGRRRRGDGHSVREGGRGGGGGGRWSGCVVQCCGVVAVRCLLLDECALLLEQLLRLLPLLAAHQLRVVLHEAVQLRGCVCQAVADVQDGGLALLYELAVPSDGGGILARRLRSRQQCGVGRQLRLVAAQVGSQATHTAHLDGQRSPSVHRAATTREEEEEEEEGDEQGLRAPQCSGSRREGSSKCSGMCEGCE